MIDLLTDRKVWEIGTRKQKIENTKFDWQFSAPVSQEVSNKCITTSTSSPWDMFENRMRMRNDLVCCPLWILLLLIYSFFNFSSRVYLFNYSKLDFPSSFVNMCWDKCFCEDKNLGEERLQKASRWKRHLFFTQNMLAICLSVSTRSWVVDARW